MNNSLDILVAEFARGTHNFLYCYMKVSRKRAGQIEKIFTDYDKNVPDCMRIKLTNLPCEPAMVGFGRGNEYANHVIYKEIQELKRKGDPSYKRWTPDLSAAQARNAYIARCEEDIRVANRTMQEDPAAYGLDRETESMDEDSSAGDEDVVVTREEPGAAVFRPPPRATSLQASMPRLSLQDPRPRLLEQTTISSFFRRADEKLDKITQDHQDTSKTLSNIESILVDNFDASNAKIDDVKKIVVDLSGVFAEKQEELTNLLNSRDHFENMSYRLRGQLGAQAVQENKPLHTEIASLKRKLEAKDKFIEKFEERLVNVETSQQSIKETLDKILEAIQADPAPARRRVRPVSD